MGQASPKAVTAGEEGSNAFYLETTTSSSELIHVPAAGPLPSGKTDSLPAHEQVFTQLFNLECFREHMMEDNFSVQAVIRSDSHSVRQCFIERVRTHDPKHLLQYHASILLRKKSVT